MNSDNTHMSASRKQLLSRLEDYLQGNLSVEDRRQLADLAEQDAELWKEIATILIHHEALAECFRQARIGDEEAFVSATAQALDATLRRDSEQAVTETMEKLKGVSRPRPLRQFLAPLAVAAGIAAAMAAGWWVSGKWQPARNAAHPPAATVSQTLRAGSVAGGVARGKWQVVARVEAASGQWTVDSGQYGKKTALKVGDEIRAGDWVVVGEGGRVRLAFVVKDTEVEIGSNAECGIRNAELLELRKGTLTANVAKQSAIRNRKSEIGRRFAVLTPHARVEVLGTRFTLRVEGSENSAIAIRHSAIPSTWLQVESGLVRFTRLADEKEIEIAAGQFAVTGETEEDFALKAYANGTEWVDGPVIFQDDFEQDLGKWKVVRWDPGAPGKCAPASAVERECVGIHEPVEGAAGTRVVVIDVRGMAGVGLGIQPRIPAMPPAWVVEFDVILKTGDANLYVMYPGTTAYRVLDKSQFKAAFRWYRWRSEIVPVRGEEGKTEYDVRFHIGGRLRERALLECPNMSPILQVKAGMVIVDNVVIRTLVPKGNTGSEK